MLRYAITDGGHAGLLEASVTHARRWAEMGIDYVQLREKQMGAGELVRVAQSMQAVFVEHGGKTKLLINSRADIAIAAAANGLHLTSQPGELMAEQVRRLFAASGSVKPVISVSCHTLDEVRQAVAGRVDLILFGPIFEKRIAGKVVVAGIGLELLREACEIAVETPVLALGGVTEENAASCVEAGAAGIAGIRLFA